MEFRQLDYFIATCEELHFTRASVKLGITQPSLSHQIKALEDELGVPLFDRIGKKIAITEAGMILYKQSKLALSNLSSAKEQIEELQQIERGTLSIGALPGELNQLVSTLLLDFHRDYPKVRIKIFGVEDVMSRVLQNELDLAITILPLEDERIQTIPLYREQFYFVATAEHPYAGRAAINFEEILDVPIVMFPETHRCRQLVDRTCTTAGHKLLPLIETTTIDSLFGLVRSGAGGTVLSKTLLEMYDYDELIRIPIQNPALCREVGIIYLRDKYMGKASRGFIDLLTAHVKLLKHDKLLVDCGGEEPEGS
ncbi:LysR family transcriptional regulator [Paenibacillus sacheonensis]|uniref:LysR family transcriptional regulator n=1 Tax=Paenibacillus sacheonensis TaxID=742054 RepID=A0A7X4YQC6_9BACL|nr:LysR family transcriptional regulator [Paenibacillus sacheonensis]MBM7566417.1 DNA-binding transcriptional LysR family regulator [Paenibacillus sacheonensis]NBC70616.1 LysR family transcriptional regulator [Paenibacillus sacheonensis]